MKEKYWLELHHIITNYNDQSDTPLSTVKIREAINQVILEERVIQEANTVTVDMFMLSPQRNEGEDLMYKYFLLRVDVPSSCQTGDDGVGDTLVCPSIKRR